MVSMKVSLLTSYCLIEANSRLRNRVVHLKSLFIQSARLNIYLSQNNQLTYQNNEFHFELIWFFLCNELRSDTDCAMRLGKLMNWRQCDRVFIGGLGLRLFNCDRLSVSPPASPLPDRAVHTRAQSTYFPSSFFIFRCFSTSFLLWFCRFSLTQKSFMRCRRSEVVGWCWFRSYTIRCFVNFNRQIVFLFFFTTLYVHWIIEEEIKHSAPCFWCALSSQAAVNSIHSLARERFTRTAPPQVDFFERCNCPSGSTSNNDRAEGIENRFLYANFFYKFHFALLSILTIHFWFSSRLLLCIDTL